MEMLSITCTKPAVTTVHIMQLFTGLISHNCQGTCFTENTSDGSRHNMEKNYLNYHVNSEKRVHPAVVEIPFQ